MQFICVLLFLWLCSVAAWKCNDENCAPKWRREFQENSLDLNGEQEDVALKRNSIQEDSLNEEDAFGTGKRAEIKNPYHRNPFRNRKLGLRSPARLIRELGTKRGSLERNFLRFGRSQPSDISVNNPQINNRTQLRKLIDKIRDKMEESREIERIERRETGNEELSDAIFELRSYLDGEIHDEDDDRDRGYLFARSKTPPPSQSKRQNTLEKNFLRFGRSVVGPK